MHPGQDTTGSERLPFSVDGDRFDVRDPEHQEMDHRGREEVEALGPPEIQLVSAQQAWWLGLP